MFLNFEAVFFDRDPDLFSFIIQYHRTGTPPALPSEPHVLEALREEARFFHLPVLAQLTRSKLLQLRPPRDSFRCVRCQSELGDLTCQLRRGGKTVASFTNPVGRVFNVIFVSSVRAVVEREAFRRSSWVDNGSWRVTLCFVCEGHLGWAFEVAPCSGASSEGTEGGVSFEPYISENDARGSMTSAEWLATGGGSEKFFAVALDYVIFL